MLKVSNLDVNVGRLPILKGVSLEVGDGEIVTVIGANGAGKTTLLRTISGLSQPSSGEIIFKGQRIDGIKPHHILKMGISQIPERGRIFPHMNVFEHLQLGAWVQHDRKQIKEDMKRICDFFPILAKRKNQAGGTLSGGERQMLAIGRALMSRPQLLLLDEPTLGLAPVICFQLGDIIRELNHQGTTVILVEQNANLALSVANRGYVLETGCIVLHGTTDELKNNPDVKKAYLGHE